MCQSFPQHGAFYLTMPCFFLFNFFEFLEYTEAPQVSSGELCWKLLEDTTICLHQPEALNHCTVIAGRRQSPKGKNCSADLFYLFYPEQTHCKMQLRNQNKYWFPTNGFSCSYYLDEFDCLVAFPSIPSRHRNQRNCWEMLKGLMGSNKSWLLGHRGGLLGTKTRTNSATQLHGLV